MHADRRLCRFGLLRFVCLMLAATHPAEEMALEVPTGTEEMTWVGPGGQRCTGGPDWRRKGRNTGKIKQFLVGHILYQLQIVEGW